MKIVKNIELGGALRKSSSQTSGYAGVRGGISALIGFGKVSPPCDIPIWLMSSPQNYKKPRCFLIIGPEKEKLVQVKPNQPKAVLLNFYV